MFKRLVKTQVWSLVITLALALGLAQGAAAQAAPATDPVAVVTAFEKLVGDAQGIDTALALWADTGVQKVIPAPQGTSGVWTGQAELRQAFQYAVANNVQREIVGSPVVDGTKVTYASLASNNVFRALGVAPVKFNTEVEVVDGKITSYINTIDPTEGPRLGAAQSVQVVTAFEKLVGDAQGVDAALALWAETGVQKVIPAPQGTTGTWTGQAELRQAFQYAVANNVKREIVGTPQVVGTKVTYASLASNNAFQALGVAPVKFNTEVVVVGGKITSYTNTMDPAEGPRLAAAVAAAQPPAPPTPGMPNTGGADLAIILAGLLVVSVLCLLAGAFVRRAPSRG